MLHLWATVTTIANTALGVVGLGVAGYTITAKPSFAIFYYGVALICVICAVVGFVNLYFLNEAVRRYEEKTRPAREERERRKAEKAAKKAEREAAKAAARGEQGAAAGADEGAAAPAAREEASGGEVSAPAADETESGGPAEER